MVREPATELIKYLNSANYSCPTIKYVLYGVPGAGKSMTLAHILHYGFESKFILVHTPWPSYWFFKCKEIANSTTKPGFVDIPLDAAKWLLHFKTQNASLLRSLNLTVSNEYVWSKRETTAAGASLVDLVDLGINRIKYASDIIVALIKELKFNCNQGKCKTLAVLDGFNIFFSYKTKLKGEDKKMIPPMKVSVTEAFLEISKSDWINGAVVLSLDQLAVFHTKPDSCLPLYLLEKEGFEHLDPFVPIYVPEYSAKEVERCLDYYTERRWLQHENSKTEEGRQELAFLSNHNPYTLMQLCNSL